MCADRLKTSAVQNYESLNQQNYPIFLALFHRHVFDRAKTYVFAIGFVQFIESCYSLTTFTCESGTGNQFIFMFLVYLAVFEIVERTLIFRNIY